MPICGHYLLDAAMRRTLASADPDRNRRTIQWVLLAGIVASITWLSQEGTGIGWPFTILVVGAMLVGYTIVYFQQKVDRLPPHWVSLEITEDDLHVAIRSANYPTAGEPPVPTGVQTSVDNRWAWDAFGSARRHDSCWVLVLSSPMAGTKYIGVPHSAFSPSDDAAIGDALVARGLLPLAATSATGT